MNMIRKGYSLVLLEILRLGGLDNLTVRLFQNDMTPTEASVLADFIQCDFSGYVQVVGRNFNTPVFDDQGNGNLVSASIAAFTQNAPTITNIAYGYYVVLNDGVTLVWSERFAAPQAFADTADNVAVVLRFGYPLNTSGIIIA